MFAFLAKLYQALVLLLCIWAWSIEIMMHQSATEHLLPGTILTILTMPCSLLATAISIGIPSLADAPFVPLVALTLAAIAQAGGIIAAKRWIRNRRNRRKE